MTVEAMAHNQEALEFAWLELTHKCNLECVHCYTSSSPRVPHGGLSRVQWQDLLRDLKEAGTPSVQFIGGEPTMSPDLPALLVFAAQLGLKVSVYSNLVHISDPLWDVLDAVKPTLVTSFYSVNELEHDAVTSRAGSFIRTRENISRAIERGLAVYVGVVKTSLNPSVDGLVDDLQRLGVSGVHIDVQRPFGRATSKDETDPVDGLCGRCTTGAVIDPDGNVHPCIMSRFMRSGDVSDASVAEILHGGLHEDRQVLREAFAARAESGSAAPAACNPDPCNPHCSPGCNPIGSQCPPNCAPILQGCPPSQAYCSPNYKPR